MPKSYKQLLSEREEILDELQLQIKIKIKCKSWNMYIDELERVLVNIEMRLTKYQIDERVKVYRKLLEKIPIELVSHVASFGHNIVDRCAIHNLEETFYI